MPEHGHIVSPLIGQLLSRVVDCAEQGVNVAIVGPMGSGISAVAHTLLQELRKRNVSPVLLDCRSPGTWQDNFREACQTLENSPRTASHKLVLVVDHAGDLPSDQLPAIRAAAIQWKLPFRASHLPPLSPRRSELRGPLGVILRMARWLSGRMCKPRKDGYMNFAAEVWVGNLDCRWLEDKVGFAVATEQRFVFQIPEYTSEHLLALYSVIGKRQESEWGEAILYTILDWCGPDLALAERLGAHFYGNWRDNVLYDDTVTECIGRWLKSDSLVEEYRQRLRQLDEPGKDLIRVLNSGGKVSSHSPYCNQEPNDSIRGMFLSGIVSPNLLPGYYQYRNLTLRLLSLQNEPDSPPVDGLDLLRKYSNGRIGNVLQDAEISLRLLALRSFNRMGYEAVRDKLKATRTDDQAVPTDLRKSLLDWAKSNGGPPQLQALGQHLAQYQKEFLASRNLWTRVCNLHAEELGVAPGPEVEPPLAKTVSYMTFAELSNLVVSLDSVVFPRWDAKETGKDSPGKRWPAYLALLRRLRNQSAHLRNVAFQDVEDLLTAVREMRRDIEKYA